LVLLDVDMVLHPQFLADHIDFARRGYYNQGVRIQLDEGATRRLLDPASPLPGPTAPGLGITRRS